MYSVQFLSYKIGLIVGHFQEAKIIEFEDAGYLGKSVIFSPKARRLVRLLDTSA